VSRQNRRTRQLGDGLCITEEDVTYENRLRRAFVLYQWYEYFIVDGDLEAWYEKVNHPGATIGGMAAGAAGTEIAGGFAVGAGSGGGLAGGGTVAAGGAGAVTVGGALLVGGAVFIGVSQAMSELKSASHKHSEGWWPVLWTSNANPC